MSDSLSGKTAVVIGAGRGLGRSVALGLADAGVRVAVVARSEDQIGQTRQLIEQAGGAALAIRADVSDERQIEQLAEQVRSHFGVVSILINAAGVFGPIQLIRDSDPQRWVSTILTNTVGPYLACRAFVGPMIDQGWGRIINFSSAATLHPPGPLNSAYGTSKVALNQFTRHLAAEIDGSGVTANVIHPGEVKTEMWAAIQKESQSAGPHGEPYRQWASEVEQHGGDDPQRAVELVLRLVREETNAPNGQFLWIKDGIQTPLQSW